MRGDKTNAESLCDKLRLETPSWMFAEVGQGIYGKPPGVRGTFSARHGHFEMRYQLSVAERPT